MKATAIVFLVLFSCPILVSAGASTGIFDIISLRPRFVTLEVIQVIDSINPTDLKLGRLMHINVQMTLISMTHMKRIICLRSRSLWAFVATGGGGVVSVSHKQILL